MDLEEALGQAIETICDIPAERVTAATPLEELGVDSLAVAEIIVELEIRLGREFPVHILRRLGEVRTVGDVVAALGAELVGGPVADPG
jgi:acyl carrier protein